LLTLSSSQFDPERHWRPTPLPHLFDPFNVDDKRNTTIRLY
jgi:hypothetical protein